MDIFVPYFMMFVNQIFRMMLQHAHMIVRKFGNRSPPDILVCLSVTWFSSPIIYSINSEQYSLTTKIRVHDNYHHPGEFSSKQHTKLHFFIMSIIILLSKKLKGWLSSFFQGIIHESKNQTTSSKMENYICLFHRTTEKLVVATTKHHHPFEHSNIF